MTPNTKKILLLLLSATITASAAEPKIVGGPFAVNVTARTATIVWIVQSDQAMLTSPGAEVRTSPSLHVEKTTLTGLQSNTQYEYNVSGQEAGKGSFKTPPNREGGSFNFVAYGDNRTRPDVHRRVIETLLKQGMPDFVLQTGDLVADGNDDSLWPVFFDIERELLRHTSFFPALGNHERNSHDFYEFFQATTPYYSFDWGNAHFAVINSDIQNVSNQKRERDSFWAEQTRWLEEDLAAHQAADFRFVTAHHPPFTAVERRQGENPHMTGLTPMFEKYHVTGAFFGHDHNYQHYLQNGIHYVITGGGGAPLYDVNKPPAGITQKVVSIENFVKVSVEGKSAHVKAIAIDGRVLDEFDISGAAQPKKP
jgi:hypothetical protein